MSSRRPDTGTGSRAHESLYPFLYSGSTDLAAVLEEARRSTVAKAAEIMDLRRAISARDGADAAEQGCDVGGEEQGGSDES